LRYASIGHKVGRASQCYMGVITVSTHEQQSTDPDSDSYSRHATNNHRYDELQTFDFTPALIPQPNL